TLGLLQPPRRAGRPARRGDGTRQRSRGRSQFRPRHDQDHAQPGVEYGTRRRYRVRSTGAGDLYADARLRARLPRIYGEATTRFRGRLMADKSFLGWPFFDDEHRTLASVLDSWAAEHIGTIPEAREGTVDKACSELVERLADAGWLDYAVPGEAGSRYENLDVRSLCLLRETLARYHGLADFAFAMQGLGSGPISLFGSEEQKSKYLPGVRRGE